MSLACRFCHDKAEATHERPLPYSVVLTHENEEKLMDAVRQIEGCGRPVPSCCVLCETCGRYSLVSYSSQVFMYSKHGVESKFPTTFLEHYQRLCILHQRFVASNSWSQEGEHV